MADAEADDRKMRETAKAIVDLFAHRGLDMSEGCTVLVFTLATVCRAAGGSAPQILEWVADQLRRTEGN